MTFQPQFTPSKCCAGGQMSSFCPWLRHCLQERIISFLQIMYTAKYSEVEASYKNCHTDIYFKTKIVVAHCGECMIWLPCPCHVVAPAILQSLIVPLCSSRGCCVVLAVSWCNTAKCSFRAVCPPWEAFDQLRCCVCFRVSLLACSAPWSSGVLSELKPGFLQIVFSRICRRVHDTHAAKC